MGVQKNNNRSDGHPVAPLGKAANSKAEGMSSGIAGGSLNYKSTAGSEKKVGK